MQLIALLVSGTDEKMVHDAAAAWAARLLAHSSPAVVGQMATTKPLASIHSLDRPDGLTVLGPIPSPVPRLRGRHRWQILVKSSERDTGLEAVRSTVKDMEQTYQRRAIKFDVDVDPIEMW